MGTHRKSLLPYVSCLCLFFVQIQCDISKSSQLFGAVRNCVYHACHRICLSFHVLHFLMKVHKTAALCNNRLACFCCLADRFFHRKILCQLLSIRFRITAAKINPIRILWKLHIIYRTKIAKFRSKLLQNLQIFFIIKTKCLIPRNRDFRPLFR